ncbi:MAG: hypothetical protein R3194_00790, partial [Limnobacter sp.]|nr:hypothetical protein [Limnobacter sp.]
LGFIPAFFVLLGLAASEVNMKRLIALNAVFALPHLFVFAGLLHAPAHSIQTGLEALGVQSEKATDFYQRVQFHREMPLILETLRDGLPENSLLATTAYSPGALMSYHAGEVVPVFGPGKYHARNDDVFVDWRDHEGKTIRVVSRSKPIDPQKYAPFFESVQLLEIEAAGVPFWVVEGTKFNYSRFRDIHLRKAIELYYQIPEFLPVLDCPFGRKYGFEDECRIGDLGLFK